MTTLVALLGDPVEGNPTSTMINAGFDHLGLDWRYVDLRVRPSELEDALRAVRLFEFAGLNVTVPHKVAVRPLVDRLDPSAALSGAVNTVVRQADGTLVGYNTDGLGFMASLADRKVVVAGTRVVLLGAGGAARAVAVELARAGARELLIVNRGAARREEVVALVTKAGGRATGVAWTPGIAVPPADIVIHCTPVGMAGAELPDVSLDLLPTDTILCDMNPERAMSPLLEHAAQLGLPTINGMGMLARGGGANFTLWTGLPAPIDVMEAALLRAVSGRPDR